MTPSKLITSHRLWATIIACLLVINGQAQLNKPLENFIDSLFQGIKGKASPGIAISVLQNGQTLYYKSYGMANMEHTIPFTHSTPVRLGYSGAREFFCVGLAIMEMQGLLRFSDKVKNFFPKLPGWSSEVTIQDLLNHSSGFDDEWATMLLMQASMNNRVDKEQLLNLLYNQPKPQVEPGKGYMYSNSDFALLRFIMEIASGKSLPDYLQQNLFVPLGMTSTFMNDQLEQIIPGLADKYFSFGTYYKNLGVKTSPGGNYRFVTTAADLEKWTAALEDYNSLVAKSILRLMKNARPIPVLSPEIHYVFGHELQKTGHIDLIKHGGVNHDFYMTRIPSQRITIIGLGNSADNMKKAEAIANYFLPKEIRKSLPAPPAYSGPYSIDTGSLIKYNGRYFEEHRNTHSSQLSSILFYDIRKYADTLRFYFKEADYFIMQPVAKDVFKDPDYDVSLFFAQQHPDSVMKLKIISPDGSQKFFYRKDIIASPSREYLQPFAGEYYSPHLDFYCRVILNEKNELILRRPTISDKILVPDAKDQFLFFMESGFEDGWYVKALFTRDKAGNIDGIVMQHIRMMHHRFEKVK